MLGEGARTERDAERYLRSLCRRDRAPSARGAGPRPPDRKTPTASRSSSRRCSRATRKRSATASSPSWCRACASWSTWPRAANLNLTIDAEESDRLELSLDVFEALAARHRRLRTRNGAASAWRCRRTRRGPSSRRRSGAASARGTVCASWCAWSRAPTGTARSSAPRRWAWPATRCSRTSRIPTCRTWPAPRRCSAHDDVIYPQFATHNAGTIAAILQMARRPRRASRLQRLHGMGEARLPRGAAADTQGVPCASTRRSASIATCSPTWCGACWRTAPTRRSCTSCRRRLGRRRGAAGVAAVGSTTPRRRCRCLSTSTAPTPAATRARANSRGRRPGRPRRARSRSSERSPSTRVEPLAEADRPPMSRRSVARAAAGFRRMERAAGRPSARRCCGAPPTRSRRACRVLRRCSSSRPARRWATPSPKCARRSISAATTPTQAERDLAAAGAARPDRRKQRAAPARPRRLRLHQPVEFPAGDLHRPGRRRAGRRQRGRRQAGRADAAGRRAQRCACCTRPGVPADALALVHGPGETVGAALVADAAHRRRLPSPARRRSRRRSTGRWRRERGAIVPLIAETGGINAMIVDSSALPEQVVDAVVQSAFRSAGQRCSALRLLCVHEDIADARRSRWSAARSPSCASATRRCSTTDVGPVIDAEACGGDLVAHRTSAPRGALHRRGAAAVAGSAASRFVAPSPSSCRRSRT